MTDEQIATWARSLHGEAGPDGFPVLHASGPLRIDQIDDHTGPELAFGDPTQGRQLSIAPTRKCDKPRTDRTNNGREYQVTLCRPRWSMELTAIGDKGFVDAIIAGLDIRNVRLATH